MNENSKIEGIKGKGRPKGAVVEEKRQPDPEMVRINRLFDSLAKEYGTGRILRYIENDTGGTTSVVVESCLNGEPVSDSIRRGVMSALKNFSPNNLPVPPIIPKPKIINALLSQKPISPRMTPEQKGQEIEREKEKIKIKKNTRREQIIIDNEKKLEALMEKLRKEGKIT